MSGVFLFLYFLFGLGLLILVHELGHFLVAKAKGIRVERFSIGFGPKLFSFQKGETEYRFSFLFFLGGYVKMTGQDDFGDEEEIHPVDDPRSFESKSILARTLVVLGGPLMNLLLPWMILPLAFILGVNEAKYLSDSPVLLGVKKESPALQAGMQKGDRIQAINHHPTTNWDDVLWQLAINQGKEVHIEVEREGGSKSFSLKVEKKGQKELPYIGIHPDFFHPPIVGSIHADTPALKAGLEPGDRIVRLNDQSVAYWADLSEFMEKNKEEPLTVVFKRKEVLHNVQLTPTSLEHQGKQYWGMGIMPKQEEVIRRYPLSKAFQKGFHENVVILGRTYEVLKSLFTANLSVKTLAGPVQIAVGTVKAAERGMGNFIYFIAFLSINLGILNLLPIPVLDGGHLVYLAYEAVFRKPLSMKLRLTFQQVGMILLLGLMVYVTFNDINRQGWFNQMFDSVKSWL